MYSGVDCIANEGEFKGNGRMFEFFWQELQIAQKSSGDSRNARKVFKNRRLLLH